MGKLTESGCYVTTEIGFKPEKKLSELSEQEIKDRIEKIYKETCKKEADNFILQVIKGEGRAVMKIKKQFWEKYEGGILEILTKKGIETKNEKPEDEEKEKKLEDEGSVLVKFYMKEEK